MKLKGNFKFRFAPHWKPTGTQTHRKPDFITSSSYGPTCFAISQLLNIPGKELSLRKLVQCLCEYQRLFNNPILAVGTKLMQNQSIRILFMLPLWWFWRINVFSCCNLLHCDMPGRKQCFLDGWLKLCAFLTAYWFVVLSFDD